MAIASPFAGAAWPLFDGVIVSYVGVSWTEREVEVAVVRSVGRVFYGGESRSPERVNLYTDGRISGDSVSMKYKPLGENREVSTEIVFKIYRREDSNHLS